MKYEVMALDRFTVRGRGTVTVIDAEHLPLGTIQLGMRATQGERSWVVTGIENYAITSAKPQGLLLRGEGAPTIGVPIVLEGLDGKTGS